ncbi:MAG: DUF2116 family Zn-ribbon domain-containing protein [Chloroflexi bacterium]|nr:DUF2116 family Zn-ribbon domain-containing protein [Chloroflexota bacterium]
MTRPGAETRLLENPDDEDEKARHCPTCGRPVTPEASFCKACGTQLVKKIHEI